MMALGSSGAICRLWGVLVEGGLLSYHPSYSYLGAWEGFVGWACVLHRGETNSICVPRG